MGTFAGAVDYCCVKQVREKVMGVTNHEAAVIPQFLTSFGYKETDPVWVEVTPETVSTKKVNAHSSTDSFTFTYTGISKSILHFNIPRNNSNNLTVRILDMKGRLVREINENALTRSLQWDGRTTDGGMIAPGSYAVSLSAGRFHETMHLTIVK
jgi:hypothetical protein